MNKHKRECIDICAHNGATVIGLRHRGKHLSVVCAEGEVFFPCTPSDWRWRHKAGSTVRRMVRGS